MARSVRDHLVDALEGLERAELKRFKAKLQEVPLRPGFAHIPRGRLQDADPLDLSDLLLSFYTDAHAAQVAARALDAVHLRQQAQRLRHDAGIGESEIPVQSSLGASGRYGLQEPLSEELHFIDKHRAELIQRTSSVEPVLDLLHGSILDDEQYERILSRETNPDKMRELYKLVPGWDRSCKDQLYESLKAKNKFLVRDLEGR
ncbi:apoptosis-associated speck-like protein containing a CARD [Paroedura picta]|uniref:apoptosis-associated speck-like protein containing a CARD n=1 Tax=Paroedura picta TaxID=143630 RepID=UPI00405696E0